MAANVSRFAALCALVTVCATFWVLYCGVVYGPGLVSKPLIPMAPKPCETCTKGRPTTMTLISPESDDVKIGDILHFRLVTKGVIGEGARTGGAFWLAIMASNGQPEASTAGHVTDHRNGTYSVFFVAGWAGQATVWVNLSMSAEATAFVDDVIWPADDRVVWQGYFRTEEGQHLITMPRGLCRLRSHGSWEGMCVYPRPRALGSTVFICEKPAGVDSCDTLIATKSDGERISAKIKELTLGKESIFRSESGNINNQAKIKMKVQISESTSKATDLLSDLPKCVPDQELPISHGYWLKGRWISLLCRMNDRWTGAARLKSCLRGKQLVLLGDSTTRQWFLGIHVLLGITFTQMSNERHFKWQRHYEDLNASIIYNAHPQLVGSLVVFLDEVNYEVDVLEGLTDPNCDYIVVVSPWAHFSQWTKDSYIERTLLLRDALVSFRARCPNVKVVLKGPHPREHNDFNSLIYAADYILKEIERINRRVLHDIGIFYLPVWAMNLAYPAPNTVHMPMPVIEEELNMFFNYVCDDDSSKS